MTKPKCFGLAKDKKTKRSTCQILTSLKPKCDKCSLHRTRAELAESQRVANERLAGLDKDKQRYIAGMYYGGEMPWI